MPKWTNGRGVMPKLPNGRGVKPKWTNGRGVKPKCCNGRGVKLEWIFAHHLYEELFGGKIEVELSKVLQSNANGLKSKVKRSHNFMAFS